MDYDALPDTGTVFHAGFPNASEDVAAIALSLDKLLIQRAASTYMWRLNGNDSERGWKRGDIAVVDRSLSPRHRDVVAAVINEEFCLRQYCVSAGGKAALQRLDGSADHDLSHSDATPVIWGVVTAIVQPLRSGYNGDDPNLNRRRRKQAL